jgi:hypothetical protein
LLIVVIYQWQMHTSFLWMLCLQHRYKSNLNDKQALEIKDNISLATDARSCKIVEAIDLQLSWAVM